MPSRSVLAGLRDSLNRQGRLFGHPEVASNAELRSVLAVLRGEPSDAFRAEDAQLIRDADYAFSQITDADAAAIATLTQLRAVRLWASPLGRAGIDALATLPRLELLEVGGAKLKRAAYPGFAGMTRLRWLGISGDAKFGDADLEALRPLRALATLRLGATAVTDAGVPLLQSLDSLEELELPLGVTDAGVAALATLPRLRAVRLQSRVTDAGVCALAAAGRLQSLALPTAKVTDRAVQALASCRALRTLDISRCTQVTDAGAVELAACTELEELNLAGTKVTGAALPAFARLPHLRTLHLQHLALTDADVPALAAIASLKLVLVGRTRISEGGIAALRRALPACDVNITG